MTMNCPKCRSERVVKKGWYQRVAAPQRVQRWFCRDCHLWFSPLTGAMSARARRPDLHLPTYALLVSGVSQRRVAIVLGVARTTVARALVRMAPFARRFHEAELRRRRKRVRKAQFDELETFEHSKLKPLSVAIAVEERSRYILGTEVSSMPAKGKLAAIARRRYGYRLDARARGLARVLEQVALVRCDDLIVKSDLCPRYPRAVARHLKGAQHVRYKGRRACVVGQGELKRGGFDPLFTLNHTCAMHRDNLKRLSRRTWCTTKRPDRLQCLLDLYTVAHNEWLRHANKRKKKRPARTFSSLLPGAAM